MAVTMETVTTTHFEGGSNLSEGTRRGNDAILSELAAEALADLTSIDARATAIEAYVGGLADPKDSVRLATAAALNACTAAGTGVGKTLTQNAAAVENIDGVAVVVGNRILVKDQVAGKDNGIYTVTTVGTVAIPQVLTRATDADSSAEMTSGVNCHVAEGNTLADTHWMLTTNDPITLDTTALTFEVMFPVAHAATHIRGATDEIDGDLVDIDYAETNYTAAVVAPATNADHLTAHLAGIDNEFAAVYARTGGVPTLTGLRVAGGTLAADGSENFTLLGTALLNSQAFATRVIGGLTFTAEEPGTPGNAESVEIVDSAGGGLAVTFAAHKLSIDMGGATPTCDQIAAAVNVAAAGWTGIIRADSAGGAGPGVTASAALAGGTGSGLKIYAGGGLCTPVGQSGGGVTSTASFSNTGLAVNPPALTGLSPALQAADVCPVWVVSGGYATMPVPVVLV